MSIIFRGVFGKIRSIQFTSHTFKLNLEIWVELFFRYYARGNHYRHLFCPPLFIKQHAFTREGGRAKQVSVMIPRERLTSLPLGVTKDVLRTDTLFTPASPGDRSSSSSSSKGATPSSHMLCRNEVARFNS